MNSGKEVVLNIGMTESVITTETVEITAGKKDEARNVGLGPEHDWSSHGADAFGLMCVAYEKHSEAAPKPPKYQPFSVV